LNTSQKKFRKKEKKQRFISGIRENRQLFIEDLSELERDKRGRSFSIVRMMPLFLLSVEFPKHRASDTLLDNNQVNAAILGPARRGLIGGLGFRLAKAHGLSILDPIDLPMNGLHDAFDIREIKPTSRLTGATWRRTESINFSASWAVRRTWRRTGIRKIRTNTMIAAMAVTLVVNSVASVGFMIISLLFRLFFLP